MKKFLVQTDHIQSIIKQINSHSVLFMIYRKITSFTKDHLVNS